MISPAAAWAAARRIEAHDYPRGGMAVFKDDVQTLAAFVLAGQDTERLREAAQRMADRIDCPGYLRDALASEGGV